MSWFQAMATAGAGNQTTYHQSTAATTEGDSPQSQYTLQWAGIANSVFDGYEGTSDTDQWTQFTVHTADWPHRIEWGNKHRSWITVTMNPASTNDAPMRVFNFYFRWTGNYPQGWPQYQHIDDFTVNFAPICEDQEVGPETFLKWLQKIGHDDAFLRVSYKMQKKMMKATNHKPPWDPRKIEELEEKRLRFMDHVRELKADAQKTWEEKLYERWGIREIPPITPELLDQIIERSTTFLKECLSEEELKWYDEEGHIKVRSSQHNNIFYVIEKKVHGNVERWVNNKHEEDICYQSTMTRLPLNDTLAMKVLDVKHNEEEFLRIGNRRRLVVRH